ncbi:MAG: hypothetical protein PHH37_01575 [Paludibacter sp.]|nr:hypothetical protein [Paludibacter sp.]
MAESKNNIVTYGLSGKVGNLLVFRNRAGKTVVSSAPRKSTGEPSEAQKTHRRRFQEAVIYGREVNADPEKKELYAQSAKEGVSVYNVAVADFMQAPDIIEINVNNYTGKTGDTITIMVKDDFMVFEVVVTIFNKDGTEVESGNAQPADGYKWTYTVTSNNDNLNGDKIVVRAYDLPGNVNANEKQL